PMLPSEWREVPLPPALAGGHRRANAILALEALAALRAAGLAIPPEAVARGLREVRWPGRLERSPREPRLWWDGAHNAAGIAALAARAAAAFAPCSAETVEPPLNLKADNVTGSRGPEGDLVLLNGNVRITRGRTVITADRGRYARAQGILDLDNHVKMVDSSA